MKIILAMSQWLVFAGGLLFTLAFSASLSYAQQFALHDGDTVVFYGDSITAQHLYTRLVEEFVLTRYPALNIHFVNAGVPGDTVYGGYAGKMPDRVQRDVAPFHPTHITVMLGMNDGGWGYDADKNEADFQMGYRELIDALHKAVPEAAITLITPSPYDEITHGTEFPGYAHQIARLAEDVNQIEVQFSAAGMKNVSIVDFNHTLNAALEHATRISRNKQYDE